MTKRRKRATKRSNIIGVLLSRLVNPIARLSKVNDAIDLKLSWKPWTVRLVILSTVILLSLSVFQGVNGDESYMTPYSYLSFEFYKSFGDYSVFDDWHNWATMRYNGVAFVLPFGILADIFGLEEADRGFHILRHFLLAILGIFMLYFVGLISRTLGNWRAAVIAIIIFLVSPRLLGHTLINPRDIPFAFGFIGSLYFILMILQNFQRPKMKHLLGLAFFMGYALSIRAGGALMLFMFFIAFYVALLLLEYLKREVSLPEMRTIVKSLGVPIAGGFLLGVFLWPFALTNPVEVIRDTFDRVTAFPVSIRILFGGDLIRSTEVPSHYLPTWIGISAPLVFLIGLFSIFFFFKRIFFNGPTYLKASYLFMFISPFLFVLFQDPALYDGWRHFTFFYVTGVPLAALGWEALCQWIEDKNWKPWIGPVIFGLLMVEPAVHIVRNYQYPYVYFNPLIGGASGAFGNYELDYWGISTRQGVEALERKGVLHADMEPIVLATNFRYSVQNWLAPEYRDKVSVEYVRYRERYNTEWDYAIWVSRFMDGTHMKAVNWPSSSRILQPIKVNNTPISVVYEKGQPYVFEAKKALDQGQINEAIQHLQQEIEWNPRNNVAYLFLGQAYMRTGNWQEASAQLEYALQYAPDDQNTILNYALTQINLEDYNEAKRILHHLVEFLPTSHGAWYYLAMANQRTGDLSLAAQYIQNCVQVRPDFRAGWQLGVEIFEEIGDQDRANLFRNRLNQL
ncbi:MAG: tetratricopeptide repeat protein [Saprospirales bacterium]|nr:MAG: tetratricopeptide repeat protein [Saprospirales bacterium]